MENITTFKSLAIGDQFMTGKIKGNIFDKNGVMYQVYKKTSSSKAICTQQIGYGNTRAVGHTYSFNPYKQIEKFNS